MTQGILAFNTPKYPRQLRFDTTTSCNAKCLSCHRFHPSNMRKGHMELEYVEKIMRDVKGWKFPLEEIVPVNYGEFFTYKYWYEFLRLAERLLPQTKVVIPTNGSELDWQLDKLLLCQNVKLLNFSINGFLGTTYELFMKLPSANINKIRGMIPKIKQQRPDITIWISMVYDPIYQSEAEKDLFVEAWKPFGTPWVLAASNCNRSPLSIHTSLPCRSLFSDMVIGFDGRVSACCFDAGFKLDLGRFTGSVEEAWHNEKLDNLRQLHLAGKRQSCLWCYGCSFA